MFIAGIGEVLVDRFEDGSKSVGGAPLNAVYHLHHLFERSGDGHAVMISRLGKDADGDFILSQLANAGLDLSLIQLDEIRPTGSAQVEEVDGEAGFKIRDQVAWDELELTAGTAELTTNRAVIFGTLAQRSIVSRSSIQEFVRQSAGPRLYDANFRSITTEASHETRKVIADSLQLATIAKLSEDELRLVAKFSNIKAGAYFDDEGELWALMAGLADMYLLDVVAVTRGAKRALIHHGSARDVLETSRIHSEPIHPVGAGDAFSAALLFGTAQGWPISRTLALCDLIASWVVTNQSACPPYDQRVYERVDEVLAHDPSFDSTSAIRNKTI